MAELFRSFDRQPLPTASMAQVHRATLHDSSEVVVKVQRPGVRHVAPVELVGFDTDSARFVDETGGVQISFADVTRRRCLASVK